MIPTEVENEYKKMAKLGFRRLFILRNNLSDTVFVSIFHPSFCKQSEWMEILRSNE